MSEMETAVLQRAFGVMQFRAVDDEQRIIEGVANTLAVDDFGTVLEPEGARFSLPLPLLWMHRQDTPVGNVTKADVTKKRIRITAQLQRITEPGPLKDDIDRAWQAVKAGLVRGLSVGFMPEEGGFDAKTAHFTAWRWRELSLVTIPANEEATISKVRSSAASGAPAPGVSGPTNPNPRRPMTIQEQITQHENSRAAKVARQQALIDASSARGETMNQAEGDEFDALETEIGQIDEHLVRLNSVRPRVAAVNGTSTAAASGSRGGGEPAVTSARGVPTVSVRPRIEPGMTFARCAMALLACKGNRSEAAEYARKLWPDTPEVEQFHRAAVAAGTTTDSAWAGPLAPVMPLVDEFIALLRPQTLIGRVNGLKRVPFNTSVPAATGGGAVSWVGQAAPKPVRALAFATVTLPFAKAAGIVVLTKELVKLSTPSAQVTVRDTMVDTMRVFLDTQFIDPAVAISSGVSPASITNGVTGTAASGTTEAAARADLRAAVAVMAAANYPVSELTWILSESVAFTLGTMVNALGQPAFPGLTVTGGNLLGIPAVTSNVVGTQIVIAHAPSVLYADDGQTEIDVSEQASVQMDDAPTHPLTSTQVMVSLWQANLVGLRFDRFATWLKARATSVHRIHTVAYV